jgi:hypothetical protein
LSQPNGTTTEEKPVEKTFTIRGTKLTKWVTPPTETYIGKKTLPGQPAYPDTDTSVTAKEEESEDDAKYDEARRLEDEARRAEDKGDYEARNEYSKRAAALRASMQKSTLQRLLKESYAGRIR